MATVSKGWLRQAGTCMLDLLFPSSCLACDAEIEKVADGADLCEPCRSQLTCSTGPVCKQCASRVPEIPGDVAECGHCREDKLRFDRALAWGQYEGLLRELLMKMKGDRSERMARMFSRMLLAEFSEQLTADKFDAVVAVPMHPWRRFKRGTNSPAVMAKTLGHQLGVPFLRRPLARRNSFTQKGLTRTARFRSMRNEIWSRAGYHLGAFRVLLIDDILTTGATCSEAARALKQAGAAEVTVLVVGRTSTN